MDSNNLSVEDIILYYLVIICWYIRFSPKQQFHLVILIKSSAHSICIHFVILFAISSIARSYLALRCFHLCSFIYLPPFFVKDFPLDRDHRTMVTTVIPTISLSNPSKLVTARLIHSACSTTGFFYLTDHCVPATLISLVLHQSSLLFDLPLHEKNALIDSTLNRGYTRFGEEKLDPSSQERGDTKEGYYIGREKVDRNVEKLKGPAFTGYLSFLV